MQMEIILLFIVSVVNLYLGLMILNNNPKSRINISFGLVALSLGAWVFSWAMAFYVPDIPSKLFWTRMMLFGPSITPSAFLFSR
jgi:hypothetical protein